MRTGFRDLLPNNRVGKGGKEQVDRGKVRQTLPKASDQSAHHQKKSRGCHVPSQGVMRTGHLCEILPQTPSPSLIMETKPDKRKLRAIPQNIPPGLLPTVKATKQQGKSKTQRDKQWPRRHDGQMQCQTLGGDPGTGKGHKRKNWWNLNRTYGLVNNNVPMVIS